MRGSVPEAALARAVKAVKSGGSAKGSRRRDCEEWLRGYLAEGSKPATECERAALAAGFNRPLLVRATRNGNAGRGLAVPAQSPSRPRPVTASRMRSNSPATGPEASRPLIEASGLRIASELLDPLPRAVHTFFASTPPQRLRAAAKSGVRRGVFAASPRLAFASWDPPSGPTS